MPITRKSTREAATQQARRDAEHFGSVVAAAFDEYGAQRQHGAKNVRGGKRRGGSWTGARNQRAVHGRRPGAPAAGHRAAPGAPAKGGALDRKRRTVLAQQEAERRRGVIEARALRRLPHQVTAGVGAIGLTGWGLTALVTSLDALPEWAVPAAMFVLAGGGSSTWYAVQHEHIDPRWRSRVLAAIVVGTLWITITAATGIGWTQLAALLGTEAVLGASWWRAHRVTAPAPPAASEPEEEPQDEQVDLDQIVERWNANIARRGGQVPDSYLTDRSAIPNGATFTVQTKEGSTEFAELVGKIGKIAGGLRCSSRDLILEADQEDASRARLTVLTTNPIDGVVPYPGPVYNGGLIPVGPYADGSGHAQLCVADKSGVYGVHASGDPGSGKSVLLENLGLSLRASGVWHVVYTDGDETGGSSDLMANRMDWSEFGITTEVEDLAIAREEDLLAGWQQLMAIERALECRGWIKRLLGVRSLLPSTEYPAVMWVIDELHRIATAPHGKAFLSRVERVVRIGRKLGVAVSTASQGLDLGDFANLPNLRNILTTRNLFAFRTTGKNAGALVGGLTIPPNTLPTVDKNGQKGGYAYTADYGAGARTAMLRASFDENMERWAEGLPGAALDEYTALAFGDAYLRRDADPERGRREAQGWLDRLVAAGGFTTLLSPAAAGGMDGGMFAAFAPLNLARPLDASNVITTAPALSESARGVLMAMEDESLRTEGGYTRTQALVESCGWSRDTIARALRELEAAGHVTAGEKQGRWYLARQDQPA